MIELKMPIDEVFFCDAGMEFPESYKYVKEMADKIFKKIGVKMTTIKSEYHTWDTIFYSKFGEMSKFAGQVRGFPFVNVKGCVYGRKLKIEPSYKYKKDGDIIYIGIAADESERVQKDTVALHKREKGTLKYPLVEWGWTEQECYDYCKKHDILNPLYKHFDRNGCWTCPHQSAKALYVLMKHYPDLWEKLKKYEADSPHGFKQGFSLNNFEKRAKAGKVRFKTRRELIK